MQGSNARHERYIRFSHKGYFPAFQQVPWVPKRAEMPFMGLYNGWGMVFAHRSDVPGWAVCILGLFA